MEVEENELHPWLTLNSGCAVRESGRGNALTRERNKIEVEVSNAPLATLPYDAQPQTTARGNMLHASTRARVTDTHRKDIDDGLVP